MSKGLCGGKRHNFTIKWAAVVSVIEGHAYFKDQDGFLKGELRKWEIMQLMLLWIETIY